MEERKFTFDVQLNEVLDTTDPSKKEVSFILHDFRQNHNRSIIKKETALQALDSLMGKPIVCKYTPVSDSGEDDDHLAGHEPKLGEHRENGDYILEFETTPIGVFTEPAYIDTIMDNGEEIEVVMGKGILWSSRFTNAVGLIQEWVNEGIDVVSSMEIVYDEYLFKDGIEEILNYWYTGHCILNSEDRGGQEKVYPAYDVSKLNHLVAQAMSKNKNKESETMPENFKKVFELSHSDIRSQLYRELDSSLDNGQYSWIVDVYDNNFIVNIFDEEDYAGKYFKYGYSKAEDEQVTIDFESKEEVMEKREWVALNEVDHLEAQLEDKERTIKSLNSEKEIISNEKSEFEQKFNSASEKIVSLNEEIEGLKEFKVKYNEEQFEKALEEKKEYYSAKFSAVQATEKFETDEVQDLIKQSVSDDSAVTQLNSILVELVVEKQDDQQDEKHYVQHSQKRSKLVETSTDFDSRYQ